MKFRLALLSLLLISCDPEKHDIDKGIAEMEEFREEEPVEDTVEEECFFDTSRYKFTLESLKGIPDIRNIQWDDSTRTASATWRGRLIRRRIGGCNHFSNDLEVHYLDTTRISDTTYWLRKAREAAIHFGIPYYPQAIGSRSDTLSVSYDPEYSSTVRSVFTVHTSASSVFDGVILERRGDTLSIDMSQYIN